MRIWKLHADLNHFDNIATVGEDNWDLEFCKGEPMLEAEEFFRGLNKASTFRLGVQILDSECEAFWVSE
ncbi:MAG TPA: hypothetical protein DG577_09425 [Firmicutes bacterium]|nr:hypothetical protein [Bacillota bacterium]HCX79620.1 hypothetical protein [Bacillota bacterium]